MNTVSVYGYGRFGKFWADLLKKDFHVKVYSRRGLKPDEVSEGVEITNLEDLHNCDAIFYCVAISSFEQVLINSKSFCRKETLFFDTCSVKMEPVRWMKTHLPQGSKIIATHPMFGPDSYSSSQTKLPMVMSNVSVSDTEFEEWTSFFAKLNLAIEIMAPETHDEIVAYSQGITHYIGRVLSDLNLQPTSISTLGYSKLLEIIQQTCNDSWQLFIDLQRFNPFTKKMRIDLHQSIEKIYSSLEAED
jgi:prephenate dehydrogenase